MLHSKKKNIFCRHKSWLPHATLPGSPSQCLIGAWIDHHYRVKMSSVAKSAASKIEWAKLIPKLGLTGASATALTSFKKRNDHAKKVLYDLKQESLEIDFGSYKEKLKNQKIVDQIEKDLSSYKPVSADITKQLNLIESFEAKALENAKSTESVVLEELSELEATLSNIQSARSFDQLTVQDMTRAKPDINEKFDYMVKNGKWEVPGYKEKFGDLNIM